MHPKDVKVKRKLIFFSEEGILTVRVFENGGEKEENFEKSDEVFGKNDKSLPKMDADLFLSKEFSPKSWVEQFGKALGIEVEFR